MRYVPSLVPLAMIALGVVIYFVNKEEKSQEVVPKGVSSYSITEVIETTEVVRVTGNTKIELQ